MKLIRTEKDIEIWDCPVYELWKLREIKNKPTKTLTGKLLSIFRAFGYTKSTDVIEFLSDNVELREVIGGKFMLIDEGLIYNIRV